MNLLRVVLILIIAVVVLAVVVVRRATANFKRLRMGCFFDLEARDLPSKSENLKPEV
jgi:hypothetical protein